MSGLKKLHVDTRAIREELRKHPAGSKRHEELMRDLAQKYKERFSPR